MAFDSSYGADVQVQQGASRLVVGPAGTLEVLGALTGPNRGGIYYVDSVAGSSSYDGSSWSRAKATLAQAVALCTADQGDTIFVSQKHAETITGAAGSGITKAGLRVIGCGVGRQRPIFTFTTATGASFDISSARCSLHNVVFVNGIDAQTAMVNVSAADVTIADCEFMLGDVTTQAALGILTTSAADRMRVERCYLHGSVDAGVAAAIRVVGGDGIVINDCIIEGAFTTTGCISNITTAATMLVIRRNVLLNRTADGNNKLLVAEATTTGIVAHNAGGYIDSTCPVAMTAAGMFWAGNHFATNVNTAGTLV